MWTLRTCAPSSVGWHLACLDAGATHRFSTVGPKTAFLRCAGTHWREPHMLRLGCGGFSLRSVVRLGLSLASSDRPNRSLVKYKLIIDDFGGWTLFQELPARRSVVLADRRGVATFSARRGESLCARSFRRRRCHCRRDSRARNLAANVAVWAHSSCSHGDRAEIEACRRQSAEAQRRRSTNSSATALGGTAQS